MSLPAIKSRKQRTIKNGPVNIDNVSIERGIAFINWTDIARQRLGQRELSLLQQRREKSDEIITFMISNFCEDNVETFDICNENAYQIEEDTLTIYREQIQDKVTDADSLIMTEYLKSVKIALSKWKGCKPHTKKMNTFRDYFQCCRKWFDSKKMEILAVHFWIPMMHLIKEFTDAASIHTFSKRAANLQNLYSNYLKSWILRGIFHSFIQPSNTRLVFLVPATIYSYIAKKFKKDHRMSYLQEMDKEMNALTKSFEEELPRFMTCSVHRSDTMYDRESNEPNALWDDVPMFDRSPSPQHCPFWESPDPDPFFYVSPFADSQFPVHCGANNV